MSLEITTVAEHPENGLTSKQEQELIAKLKELRTLADSEWRPIRDRRRRVIRAYECKHDDLILKRVGSKAYLPWVYTSIESGAARLSNALIPNIDDTFNLEGITEDDHPGAEMMEKYMKVKFGEMGLQDLMEDAIRDAQFGDVMMKIYWQKILREYTGQPQLTQMTDETGNPMADESGHPLMAFQAQKQQEATYNFVNGEVINYDDYFIYPLTGDMSRTSTGHRVYRHKDELLEVQEASEGRVYRNVDLIEDNTKDFQPKQSSTSISGSEQSSTGRQGLEVWEYYLHRVTLDGQVFRCMIATVVEDKWVIRFTPNDYDYGLVPFIYCPLIKDYNKNTGHGTCDRAIELQKMANFTVNQIFDESKIKLYGIYKYKEDGVFNPATMVARPNGLVKVNDLNNVQRLDQNIGNLSFGVTELQYFEQQFEAVTNTPKFLKGMVDTTPGKNTATQKRLEAEGSDNRFRSMARRVNNKLLVPFITMSYVLIRQYAMTDYEVLHDIARVTQKTHVDEIDEMTGQKLGTRELSPQELIESLPAIPPLSRVDVKVVGFENTLDKAEKANQFERFMAGVSQWANLDPSLLKRIKPELALDNYGRYLSIDSSMIRTEKEMLELYQQEMAQQQQQLEMMARMGINPAQMMNGGQPVAA